MRSQFPKSLLFFAVTFLVAMIQAIPVVGFLLLFVLAPFWSVFLVNAGMVGTAIEASLGRVSRWWLLLPIAYFGGYLAFAAQEQLALRSLSASFEAANARIALPFDPRHHALVFLGEDRGAWLTQNYALPVTYSANANFPEKHLSHRMMGSDICDQVRREPTMRAAFVHAFGFYDGEGVKSRMSRHFCALSMPEAPTLAQVRIAQHSDNIRVGSLPVSRTTTAITMPDGQRARLLGGSASPLGWLPIPVIGCGLGFRDSKCQILFWRQKFTPIIGGTSRYSRDSVALARALGLKPVAIEDRRGGDPALVLAKIAAVEDATLARQLANVDAIIANPMVRPKDWDTGMIASRPEALAPIANSVMTGIERAAAATGHDLIKTQESGSILTRLLAKLPHDRFVAFGPRILALYAKAGEDHWLWGSEALIRRLGDLGTGAIPYLIDPRTSTPSVNAAGAEGLCRVGSAGRHLAEPALLTMWARSRDGRDSDARAAMFVAMRRMGIAPPPLPEDKRGQRAALAIEWKDISPASPPRVCAVRAEQQARREEKISGERRTNLE